MKKDIFFRGKPVATVIGNTLNKTISRENIFWKTYSVSIAKTIINQADNLKATQIRVRIRETGGIYQTSIANRRSKNQIEDNGFWDHYYLPNPLWKKMSSETDKTKHGCNQLRMF